jgi:flagellar motor protein MotB
MIKKGMAPEVVGLMAPYVKHGHHLVVTNISFCLSELLQVEQQLLQQQQQQQQQQFSGGKKQKQKQQQEDQKQQQDQQQLPPVLATVLELVEVQKFTNTLGPNLTYNPGQFYQVRFPRRGGGVQVDPFTFHTRVSAGWLTGRLTRTVQGARDAFSRRGLLAQGLLNLRHPPPSHLLSILHMQQLSRIECRIVYACMPQNSIIFLP